MTDNRARQKEAQGTLYVVATPIGNLEDITLRALNILSNVDVIAVEGVRHSMGLCSHYGIKTGITGYNQHNNKTKGPELIRRLKAGSDVALITNAGTPGISDPGVSLIRRALDEDIVVSPIPGPSAVTAAISASGLPGDRFRFVGFLSNKPGGRKKELEGLASESQTMVFFEAPHRIRAMLTDLKDIFEDRQIVLVREQTKLHEEVIRGSADFLLGRLKGDKLKGEFTLVVSGKKEVKDARLLGEEIKKRIKNHLNEGKMSLKDIAKFISGEIGMTYRTVYRECLKIKEEMADHRQRVGKTPGHGDHKKVSHR
jgi:16S rRNA (cytidine1402-2'-O)-methyltransferase